MFNKYMKYKKKYLNFKKIQKSGANSESNNILIKYNAAALSLSIYVDTYRKLQNSGEYNLKWKTLFEEYEKPFQLINKLDSSLPQIQKILRLLTLFNEILKPDPARSIEYMNIILNKQEGTIYMKLIESLIFIEDIYKNTDILIVKTIISLLERYFNDLKEIIKNSSNYDNNTAKEKINDHHENIKTEIFKMQKEPFVLSELSEFTNIYDNIKSTFTQIVENFDNYMNMNISIKNYWINIYYYRVIIYKYLWMILLMLLNDIKNDITNCNTQCRNLVENCNITPLQTSIGYYLSLYLSDYLSNDELYYEPTPACTKCYDKYCKNY